MLFTCEDILTFANHEEGGLHLRRDRRQQFTHTFGKHLPLFQIYLLGEDEYFIEEIVFYYDNLLLSLYFISNSLSMIFCYFPYI